MYVEGRSQTTGGEEEDQEKSLYRNLLCLLKLDCDYPHSGGVADYELLVILPQLKMVESEKQTRDH